jgi:hypothetical protein
MPNSKPAPEEAPHPKTISSTVQAISPASNRLLAEILPQLSRRPGKVGQLARRFLRLRGIGSEKALLQFARKADTYKFAKNLLRIVIVKSGKPTGDGGLVIVATDKELLRGISAGSIC